MRLIKVESQTLRSTVTVSFHRLLETRSGVWDYKSLSVLVIQTKMEVMMTQGLMEVSYKIRWKKVNRYLKTWRRCPDQLRKRESGSRFERFRPLCVRSGCPLFPPDHLHYYALPAIGRSYSPDRHCRVGFWVALHLWVKFGLHHEVIISITRTVLQACGSNPTVVPLWSSAQVPVPWRSQRECLGKVGEDCYYTYLSSVKGWSESWWLRIETCGNKGRAIMTLPSSSEN